MIVIVLIKVSLVFPFPFKLNLICNWFDGFRVTFNSLPGITIYSRTWSMRQPFNCICIPRMYTWNFAMNILLSSAVVHRTNLKNLFLDLYKFQVSGDLQLRYVIVPFCRMLLVCLLARQMVCTGSWNWLFGWRSIDVTNFNQSNNFAYTQKWCISWCTERSTNQREHHSHRN